MDSRLYNQDRGITSGFSAEVLSFLVLHADMTVILSIDAPASHVLDYDSTSFPILLALQDDVYDAYDKPMRADKPTTVYRPSAKRDEFGEDEYEKIVCPTPRTNAWKRLISLVDLLCLH